jgi:hypothetical protein
MGGVCSTLGAMGKIIEILTGHREGKRPLVIPMLTWEDNIKTYLKKTCWMCEMDSTGSG